VCNASVCTGYSNWFCERRGNQTRLHTVRPGFEFLTGSKEYCQFGGEYKKDIKLQFPLFDSSLAIGNRIWKPYYAKLLSGTLFILPG
jgi:hypothetical protein